MMLPRRTFLFGLAAVLASPGVKTMERYLDPVSTVAIPPFMAWRAIDDLCVACMPTGDELRHADFREDPVHIRVMRNGDVVLDYMMNPRANMRWVALGDGSIVTTKDSLFSIQFEPAHTRACVTIGSDIEQNRNVRRRRFSECYEWTDSKLTLQSVTAFSLQDQHLLTG